MDAKLIAGLDSIPHWKIRFAKGKIIYDEGEPSISMYRIEQGCVRLQINGADGDRQIVTFLFPGDVFGFCLERRNCAAEAVTEVNLTRYAIDSVLGEYSVSKTAVGLLNTANIQFGDLARHVSKITHLCAIDRVLWFFSWLAGHDTTAAAGGLLKLPMSQRDISDFLSLEPETLSRCLKRLQVLGYLVPRGRRSYSFRPNLARPRGGAWGDGVGATIA